MTKQTRVVAYLLLFAAAVSLASIAGCVERQHRLGVGCNRLQAGQSRREVVGLLGEPSEVERCSGPTYAPLESAGHLEGPCAERYVYYSLMERRGVALDADGAVISKYYNVSH